MTVSKQLHSLALEALGHLDALAADESPVCLALMGEDLGLIGLVRMPGVPARIEHMAIGKAYTCAKMGCTTGQLHERLQREGITLEYFMDPRLTAMRGGVPMTAPNGTLLFGIGVSGRTAEQDEKLALKIREFLLSKI